MSDKYPEKHEYFECPFCGASVPLGAAACRECGSDEETGWSSDAFDTPLEGGYADDDFDYDDFVRREFPEQAPQPAKHVVTTWAYRALVIVLTIGLLLLMLW